jgi:hypothetical protein
MSLTKRTKGTFLQIQYLTANNMHGVWKRILPHRANSSDFEEETVIQEINILRELGSDELENEDILEGLKLTLGRNAL